MSAGSRRTNSEAIVVGADSARTSSIRRDRREADMCLRGAGVCAQASRFPLTIPAASVADGSFHAVAGQFLGDVGLNQFRQRDIAVAATAVAFPPFHDSAAVKRAAELRIEGERRVVVEKRAVELAEPQIGNAPCVEIGGIGRAQLYRLLA